MLILHLIITNKGLLMLGVILCGGKSTRMGSDKGLIKLDTDNWAKVAADKLKDLGLPVFFSVNATQYPEYAAIFPAEQLIKDNDTLQIRGPLYGVLSVHLIYPDEDLFILACDMPLMETSFLKDLLNHYHQNNSPEAFVYSNDGEPEPLCGIYKANGLARVIHLYNSNQLPKHSMKYILEHVSARLIPITKDQKKYFKNFNARAELNGL